MDRHKKYKANSPNTSIRHGAPYNHDRRERIPDRFQNENQHNTVDSRCLELE